MRKYSHATPISILDQDAYNVMPILLTFNAIAGIFYFNLNPAEYILHILTSVAVAVALDTFINYIKLKKFVFSKSGLISGLIIGSLLGTGKPELTALAAAAAILSKHIVKLNNIHIFNPAATGAFIANLVTPLTAWWAGNPFTLLFLYPDYLVKKIQGVVFLVSWYALQFLTGSPLYTLNYPILFFALIMAIEPVTTPNNRKAQIVFGIALALLMTFAAPYAKFDLVLGSLLFMNIFSRWLDSKLI